MGTHSSRHRRLVGRGNAICLRVSVRIRWSWMLSLVAGLHDLWAWSIHRSGGGGLGMRLLWLRKMVLAVILVHVDVWLLTLLVHITRLLWV